MYMFAQENFDLQRQAQELDAALTTATKARSSLQTQLDDLKKQLEDEIRVCTLSASPRALSYAYAFSNFSLLFGESKSKTITT